MTLLAFKGTDRLHIYDRRDVRDDLLTQFREAIAFLKKHLNVRSEIRGVNREDIYELAYALHATDRKILWYCDSNPHPILG